MGGSVSRGKDNQSLIDELQGSGASFTPEIERVMRLVDRGEYFDERSPRAYMDLAWRSGTLHLSAPSIYVVALRHLDLKPGLHFLNIGSGTGYFSTMVGLILGYNGVNHGIEYNAFNVAFARKRLAAFMDECDAPYERDFCAPHFIEGNIFHLLPLPARHAHENRPEVRESANADAPLFAVHVQTSTDRTVRPEADDSPVEPPTISRLNVSSTNDSHDQSERSPERTTSTDMASDTNAVHAEETTESEDENDDEEFDVADDVMSEPIDSTGHFTIGSPPVVITDASKSSEQNDLQADVVQWPTYDRIYVGAAITDRTQLETVLRLLKVGGILVAPVQDKFVKVTRTAEDQTQSVDLMAVSFASLVVPTTRPSDHFAAPPLVELPRLEQLCARVIRSCLRPVIERRHNGVPQLGRLEETEEEAARKRRRRTSTRHATTSDQVDSTDSTGDDLCEKGESKSSRNEVSSQSQASSSQGDRKSATDSTAQNDDTEVRVISDRNNTTTNRDGDTSPSRFPTEARQVAWFLRYLMAHHDAERERSNARAASQQTQDPETTRGSEADGRPEEGSQDTTEFGSTIISTLSGIHSDMEDASESSGNAHTANPLPQPTDEITDSEIDDEPAESDESDPTPRQRAAKKKSKRKTARFIPPSYTYREEIKTILTNELHLRDFFVRAILTLQ